MENYYYEWKIPLFFCLTPSRAQSSINLRNALYFIRWHLSSLWWKYSEETVFVGNWESISAAKYKQNSIKLRQLYFKERQSQKLRVEKKYIKNIVLYISNYGRSEIYFCGWVRVSYRLKNWSWPLQNILNLKQKKNWLNISIKNKYMLYVIKQYQRQSSCPISVIHWSPVFVSLTGLYSSPM